MPSNRGAKQKLLVHLRLDAEVVEAIDAFASRWRLSRADAATRLLEDGIGQHIDELVDIMQTMVRRFSDEEAHARSSGTPAASQQRTEEEARRSA